MAITITSVSPTHLPENGGTTIRVVGTGLNTVTGVNFNGSAVSAFNKVSNTILEFGSPALTPGTAKSIVLILTDGTTPVNKSTSFDVLENGKSFAAKTAVRAYHTGTVNTSATGEKAPWVQQVNIMKIVDNKGKEVEKPVPVKAPQYQSTTSGLNGYGN